MTLRKASAWSSGGERFEMEARRPIDVAKEFLKAHPGSTSILVHWPDEDGLRRRTMRFSVYKGVVLAEVAARLAAQAEASKESTRKRAEARQAEEARLAALPAWRKRIAALSEDAASKACYLESAADELAWKLRDIHRQALHAESMELGDIPSQVSLGAIRGRVEDLGRAISVLIQCARREE